MIVAVEIYNVCYAGDPRFPLYWPGFFLISRRCERGGDFSGKSAVRWGT